MIFKMVFSGPCAYVQNRLDGSPDPATSWSAILPDLASGREVSEVIVQPHYAVLQFPTDMFNADPGPDLRFRIRDGQEFGIIFMSGYQVRIETGASHLFLPALFELDQETLASGKPKSEEERVSLDWLPSLAELLPGAGVFGSAEDEVFFDERNGLPVEGNISAHVLLDRGRFVTRTLIPDRAEELGIWGFQSLPGHPFVARQAVAYSVELQLNLSEKESLSIRLIRASEERVVSLRQDIALEEVVVEMKNREMDEIVERASGTIEPGDVDRDFKLLYLFSGTHREACPLPVLTHGEGVGTRRTTCGGARFVGLAPSYSDILSYWMANSATRSEGRGPESE